MHAPFNHRVEPAPLRWQRQSYCPRECPTPLIETVSLDEIIGNVLPADLIAALAGHRGAALHIGGGAP
jgi:hypothetical protein